MIVMAYQLLRRQLHTSFPAISKPTTRKYLRPSSCIQHLRRSESTAAVTASNTTNEGLSTSGSIFFTSLCALTFGLGAWQTKRYFEKIELVKKREEELKLQPLDWDQWQRQNDEGTNSDNAAKEKSYRRVILRGSFQHQNQILVGPRGPPPGALAESGPNSGRGGGGGMSSSMQGYWVISPFLVHDGMESDVFDESSGGEKEEKKGWFGCLFSRRNRHVQQDASNQIEETTTDSEDGTIVWINRGWIPRHFINNDSQILQQWEQPTGIVKLMTMESQTETPGRFSPPSRLETRRKSADPNSADEETVKKLLWMDRTAISELTNSPAGSNPPLFVQIKDEEETMLKYPARSSREYVGEFKVTPEVHAGYAATWFGLSGAGVVMTKKLLRRGR